MFVHDFKFVNYITKWKNKLCTVWIEKIQSVNVIWDEPIKEDY
jgi:hypothetical protein